MRRPLPDRFSLIVPIHVASRLAMMSRETAERLRAELHVVTELALRAQEVAAPGKDKERIGWVEADGVRLLYRVDPSNRSVVALELEGDRPR